MRIIEGIMVYLKNGGLPSRYMNNMVLWLCSFDILISLSFVSKDLFLVTRPILVVWDFVLETNFDFASTLCTTTALHINIMKVILSRDVGCQRICWGVYVNLSID